MNAIILFIICTAVNVVLSTIKSIATINGGKFAAAFWNAVTYGFYTYVVILTTVDNITTLEKMLITFACNFVGVYIVKLFEEKARKDKLWKVEATVYDAYTESLHNELAFAEIPHNYIPNIGKYTVFNIYCETQTESRKAKEILDYNKAKYFVSESKTL